MTSWSIRFNNEFTDIMDDEAYAKHCHQILHEREDMHPFIGDSRHYYIIRDAAMDVRGVPGLFCEIGLRKGGGTKIMMDAVIQSGKPRTVIAIDPYGTIPYEGMEGEHRERTEYSSEMQKDTLEKMYRFVAQHPNINFVYFPLEDTEFMKRYSDGVPVYVEGDKSVVNEYALVHFDGPHTVDTVMKETKFFDERTGTGAMFVYDDVEHFYDHDQVENFLFEKNWHLIEKTISKASYRKIIW